MNFFNGAVSYIAGAPAAPTAAIPRLVDRVASSTLPRDRRAALADLAAAVVTSPRAQMEMCESGLKVVYAVLEQDRDFDETLRVVLDVLIGACGVLEWRDVEADGDGGGMGEKETVDAKRRWERKSAEAAGMGTDVFLGLPGAMRLLLELLDNPDVIIKCSTIELLTAMTANAAETTQSAVLSSEEAVAKIADLLETANPIVRTNATLLLSALADGSGEICKIVAFSGVLETLFRILMATTVGWSGDGNPRYDDVRPGMDATALADGADPEGAMAVGDTLVLVRNLLRGSSSTQSLMRDSGCIPKLAHVLSYTADCSASFSPAALAALNGPAEATAVQNYTNLLLALECVTALVDGDGRDLSRNRSACAASGVFRTVMQLCFALPTGGDVGERTLLRVTAMIAASGLVVGQDDIRALFASPMSALSGVGRSRSPQIACVDVVTADESPAVRAAAHQLLMASLMADPALKLPTASFLNALVTESESFGGPPSPSASSAAGGGVATALKAAVVGWPNEMDGAGVFYTSCTVAWVTARIRGARERLLASKMSGGSGDALLSRAVRALGQAVREDAPAPVRISLLRLVCTWLHGSSSAVSAFLSSAMHLPLVMEMVMKKSSSRSDAAASIHVQGLSALLLAVCLDGADGDDSATDSGFVSGGGGASTVIPRGTLVDIVRNRIGVATFTARLDELRATPAFLAAKSGELGETEPLKMVEKERASPGAYKRGELGHELWYDADFVELVEDVYAKVGARVIELVAQPDQGVISGNGGGDVTANDGSALTVRQGMRREVMTATNSVTPSTMNMPMIESSSRDDVLVSYKELIRTQDGSLADARARVGELEAALKEAQLELDAQNRVGADGASRTERERLIAENAALQEKAATLEDVVEEKTSEFAALSDAYSALEQMGANAENEEAAAEREQGLLREVELLRRDKASTMSEFYAECDKVTRLEQVRSRLELTEQTSMSQLRAVEKERDSLRAGGDIDDDSITAADWRRRAEASEGQLGGVQSALNRCEETVEELRGRTRGLEDSYQESNTRASTLSSALEQIKIEAAQAVAARKREASMAREGVSATQRAHEDEVSALRAEMQTLALKIREEHEASASASGNVAGVASAPDAAVREVESLSAELVDVRNAMEEWKQRATSSQRKCEDANRALDRERAENQRLAAVARDAQAQVQSSRSELETLQNDSSANMDDFTIATDRVTELEKQCADMEEMRCRSLEELTHLKEEVATRTEQTIRLSGNVYEAEEACESAQAKLAAAEARISELEAGTTVSSLGDAHSEPNGEHSIAQPSTSSKYLRPPRSEEDDEYISALSEEIMTLKEKIVSLEEAVDDARDKEGLSSAIALDRDEALTRLQTVEGELASVAEEKAGLKEQLVALEDRLLSLGEAEEAKRVLTERVGELEQALVAAESLPPTAGSTYSSPYSPRSDSEKRDRFGHDDNIVSSMRRELDEKKVLVKELENSLISMADGERDGKKTLAELEKQVSEAETLLSVVSSEKTEQAERLSVMDMELDGLRSDKEALTIQVSSLTERAVLAEQAANSASNTAPDSSHADALKAAEDKLRDLAIVQSAKTSRLSDAEQEILGLNAQLSEAIESKELQVEEVGKAKLDAVSLEGRVDELQCDLAKGVLECQSLTSQLAEALQKLSEGADRILTLESEVSSLNAQFAETEKSRDVALKDLEESKQELQNVEVMRSTAMLELSVLSNAGAGAKEEINLLKAALADSAKACPPNAETVVEAPVGEAAEAEIRELKRALRDAAKSVNASSKELTEHEELLVQLSDDKSSLLRDLDASRAEVESLRQNIRQADEEKLRLEQRRSPDLISSSATGAVPSLALSSTVDSEALVDLAAAKRSVAELEGNMGRLETKQKDFVVAKKEDRALITSLVDKLSLAKDEVSQIQKEADRRAEVLMSELEATRVSDSSDATVLSTYRAENSKLRERLSRSGAEFVEIRSTLQEQVDSLSVDLLLKTQAVTKLQKEKVEAIQQLTAARESMSSSDTANEQLQASYDGKSSELRLLTAELGRVQSDMTDSASAHVAAVAKIAKERSDNASSHAVEMAAARSEIEALTVSLQVTRAEADQAKAELSLDVEAKRQRISELEHELVKSCTALEVAEKDIRELNFANREAVASAKAKVVAFEEELLALKTSLNESMDALRALQSVGAAEAAALTAERDELKNDLAVAESKTVASESKLAGVTRALANVRAELSAAEKSLSSSQKSLATLEEERAKLNEESKALEEKISNLESLVVQGDTNLAAALGDIKRGEVAHTLLLKEVTDAQEKSSSLEAALSRRDEENGRLRIARGRLEEEADILRTDLDAAESARDGFENDNTDLRAWVTDLEEQAKGLHGLAEKFDDVEASLHEALAAHQTATDANAELKVEVCELSNAVSTSEAATKAAENEKVTAVAARKLAEKRVLDLDARLQETRSSYASKATTNEGKIRSNAQRCADLELELASAERQIAESASMSDRIFGIEAELSRASERAKELLERAEVAEGDLEGAKHDIADLHKQIETASRSAGASAYAELEAEHNELLICLAELELEQSALRENNTTGNTPSRTVDSISAR